MMWKATCEHQNFEEVLVHIGLEGMPDDPDPDGIGFLAYRDGTPTHRWADGTVGITDFQRDLIAESEAAYCLECLTEMEWKHVR